MHHLAAGKYAEGSGRLRKGVWMAWLKEFEKRREAWTGTLRCGV